MGRAMGFAVVVLALIAAGCTEPDEASSGNGGAGEGPELAQEQERTTPRPATPDPTPEPTPFEPAPIELSGNGQAASETFELVGGLTVYRVTCSGGGTCSVWVLSGSSGEQEELIANDLSPYEGSTAVRMPAGEYLFDVDTGGPWTITVEQPRATEGPNVPHDLQGTDKSAAGPLRFPGGLVIFDIDCPSDEGVCSIWLLDSDGGRVELLANETAPHSASKAVGVAAGIYWLDIDAEGSWSIATRSG